MQTEPVESEGVVGALCLHHQIRQTAEKDPSRPAILSPGRAPLTYGRLGRQLEDVARTLRSMGVARTDRVAMVLPDGPECAVAVLGIAASATCAPLNPAYRAGEFESFLSDLRCKALVVQAGQPTPAAAVARARGISILELSPLVEAEAGLFTLGGGVHPAQVPMDRALARSSDVALALHTSGTSSRAKLVPLTHRNLCVSARDIGSILELTEADRCLGVMPLFHIHGLSALFASLLAGSSIVCAPGFSPEGFFECLGAFRPTWYTAAPTLHQAILEHALARPEASARTSLRLIRSASAPMPRRVIEDLERLFGVPFLEAYGMTEAAPQIAGNRLPPHPRKPGSVGRSAGPDVAIVNPAGDELPPGETGEVVIRGANVIRRYADDPSSDAAAFTRGWLRTGDVGHLDAEGYLFITGRLKEVINRGGEKISPREIDEVLAGHPAVAQAATFAVPHPTLGQEVAAAVVLRPGHRAGSCRDGAVSTDAGRRGSAGFEATNGDLLRGIRSFVSARLAHFKVPHRIVIVDEIPRGPTGKLCRAELGEKLGLSGPGAGSGARGGRADFTPPRTPVEEKLAGIVAGVLDLGRIGIHDDFFLSGGDSLTATRVLVRIAQEFRLDLPVSSLFERPTVSELGELVARHLAESGALREARPVEGPAHASGDLAIERTSEATSYPLSFAQERLWTLDRIEPGDPAYNMPVVLRLSGPLEVATLERSLAEVLRRHESLRTYFPSLDGRPVQAIAPAKPVRLPVVDLAALPESGRRDEALRLAAEESGHPFHLARGPLFRTMLVRLDPEEHMLLLSMHHIISDAWSTGVLHRELQALYHAFAAGRGSPLPELPIRYVDFAAWQRRWSQGRREGGRGPLEAQLAYWRSRLEGLPTLDLPTDRPRPASQAHRGARYEMAISPAVTEELRALSRREGATLFMTLLAAFQALLHRYSGQDDLAVGIPIANRNPVETEGLIGFFANTLVLRADLSGQPSFREFLARVRMDALDAYANQDVPFERLVEELRPGRDPGITPLFRVMFAYQNVPDSFPGWRAERGSDLSLTPVLAATPLRVDVGTAKFDLTLYLWEVEQGLAASWQYNTDLFEAATIGRMAAHLRALLTEVLADPERPIAELRLTGDHDRDGSPEACEPIGRAPDAFERRGETSGHPAHDPRSACYHRLFEEQAGRTPDRMAVQCGADRLTYRGLNERANQVARRLRARGVGPGTRVGVFLARSAEVVVSLLGILKAGGVHVPLDPDYPADRIGFMLEDAGVSVVITEGRSTGRLPRNEADILCLDTEREAIAGGSPQDLEATEKGTDLAYLIYTSGSTVNPKGVMITHGNVCHYVRALRSALGLTGSDRYLHTASFSFSSSVRQCLLPLSCGASVVLATTDEIRDPLALFGVIRRHGVSILDVVPSYWRSCTRLLAGLEPDARSTLLDNELRLILSASEPLPADVPRSWSEFRHPARLINMFGQTETTGIVTLYPIPADGPAPGPIVPIGRPIEDTRVYLLDAHRQPVPRGVKGELYIGGAGVGQGYLRQPGLTEQHFVPDPFGGTPGTHLYRTGDLARRRPDGNLEFCGRLDQQVKVGGFRIEPGEIEAVLRQHPAVREAVAVPRGELDDRDREGSDAVGVRADRTTRLVAFVVLEPGMRTECRSTTACDLPAVTSPVGQELREYLGRKLPGYMVPSAVIELAALPMTSSGKVDRKALASPSAPLRPVAPAPGPEASPAAPRTLDEQILSTLWAQVLEVERVGRDENFFELGGNSLLAIQMIDRANQSGFRLRPGQLFQHQTIARLAGVAASERPEGANGMHGDGDANGNGRAGRDSRSTAGIAAMEAQAVRATIESLRAYGREALERGGLPPEGAAIVTEVQLEASLRGQPTHNMGAIPEYVRRMAIGAINPRPCIRPERETAVSALIDGDDGPGQWVAVVAMETAIRKAHASGVGVVGVRRSCHFGAAGHYAWLAARADLIGLCTTNAPLSLAPTGGVTPTFGNNPLGVGIPAGEHDPIVLDIAMSVAARGKIGLHLAEGHPLPTGWILDRFGRPSTDPADLLAGLGVPIGGHKGYGLTLAMEALAGVLTGAGFCWDHRREPGQHGLKPPDFGHMFIVVDPEIFMPIAEFKARTDRMIEQSKGGERVEGVEEILIPGEMEMRARRRNLREGVPLLPSTHRALLKHRDAAGLGSELVIVG